VPDPLEPDEPTDFLGDDALDEFDEFDEFDDDESGEYVDGDFDLDDETTMAAMRSRIWFRIKKRRDGSFTIALPDNERDLLESLPGQLRELLQSDDPSLRRLFPAAYHQDQEKEDEYQRLMREELMAVKISRAELLEQTARATTLTEGDLMGWMGAVNDVRLVLGTQLDVSEDSENVDDDDPRAPVFEIYHYLGFLLENIIKALSD
jgi:Domain of unknown function (DUF2017)